MSAPVETAVQIANTAGGATLDGLVADCASHLAVVITHPWGPLGGNMNNNVVHAAALYFQRFQITTVRFNFAGSQIGRGHAQVRQVQDVVAALLGGRITKTSPPKYVLLVGYSYGSLITTSASAFLARSCCVGTVSIAPPFGVQHWLLLFGADHHLRTAAAAASIPRFFVLGSRDNFTGEAKFQSVLETYFQNQTGAILKDADHFLARREKDVMDVIGEWLIKTFPQCKGDLRKLRDLEIGLK